MQTILFAVVIGIFVATAIITLLGITGHVNVKEKYLTLLVVGLLAEGAVAVFAQFQALDLNQQPSVPTFIASLSGGSFTPTTTEAQARAAINQAFVEAGLVPGLQTDLTGCRTDLNRVTPYENHFLVKVARLQNDSMQFGNSVNLEYPDQPEKHAIYELLLELLAELGHYEGDPLDDPATARAALVEYQRKKGFSTPGFLSRATIDALVNEYLTRSTVAV